MLGDGSKKYLQPSLAEFTLQSLAQAEIGAVMVGPTISNLSPKAGISRCFAGEDRVELSGITNFLQHNRETTPKTSFI